MRDIDNLLAVLNNQPLPPGLARIDAGIIEGVGLLAARADARRGVVLAACVAGMIGLGVGLSEETAAIDEPLLAMPASAPSHLLVG